MCDGGQSHRSVVEILAVEAELIPDCSSPAHLPGQLSAWDSVTYLLGSLAGTNERFGCGRKRGDLNLGKDLKHWSS